MASVNNVNKDRPVLFDLDNNVCFEFNMELVHALVTNRHILLEMIAIIYRQSKLPDSYIDANTAMLDVQLKTKEDMYRSVASIYRLLQRMSCKLSLKDEYRLAILIVSQLKDNDTRMQLSGLLYREMTL